MRTASMPKRINLRRAVLVPLLAWLAAAPGAGAMPYSGAEFKGRIAHSADGNANDEDDWAAFPVAFALIDAFGMAGKVVHVDYNNILAANDARFYREMTTSVRGAAERFHLPARAMFDCQQDLEGALENIRKAINDSSADNPLYFILAGPMEVPLLGIRRSDPAKRKYVYCISHSQWNDGFPQPEKLHLHKFTKRDVIETGVNWVQVKPGNGLSNSTRTSSTPEQWLLYRWMRDAADARLGWIHSRMEVEGRCDVSDATMTYFLLTGDEEATPAKLQAVLADRKLPVPVARRDQIRIEAENFARLENYTAERRNDRAASHRVAVVLAGGREGRIRTTLNQPYAPDSGVFNVEVRYFDGRNGRSAYRLSVGGTQREWKADADTDSWQSRTFAGIPLQAGGEIEVAVRADGAETGRLDYVQLSVGGVPAAAVKASMPAVHPRFSATGPLDDKDALPGQIIVAGQHPGYLKYNGGGIAFLCGPDNPETFLYLGELQPDGTRAKGEQQRVIDRIASSGANAFHFILWRMHRSNIKDEGDDTHCPFVDHDPAKPLNETVLSQWEGWFTQLERAGVVLHVELYDDATDVERIGWTLDANGRLHADERRYVAGIVNRFKHHRNIIWSVGESVNKLPRARVPHFKRVTELIAATDTHHHPILLSFVTPDTAEKDIGRDYVFPGDYRDDPHVRLVTWLHVLPHGDDYDRQHEEYLRWSRVGLGQFIVMKNETERFPRTLPQSRIYMWASVMTGQHSLEAGHDVLKRANLLAADGHIARFMEQTDFHAMQPSDTRASGSTKWVLASEHDSYIAYSYACDGPMGLKGVVRGSYTLTWLDTVSGKIATQRNVAVAGGDAAWLKPESFGREIALYVKREARPAPRRRRRRSMSEQKPGSA